MMIGIKCTAATGLGWGGGVGYNPKVWIIDVAEVE